MNPIFSKEINFTLSVSEPEFINWFNVNIDRPGLHDFTTKHSNELYGEMKNQSFWIKKKNSTLYKGSIPLFNLVFSDITGILEPNEEGVLVYIRTSLNGLMKTLLITGILLTTVFFFYQIINNSSGIVFYLISVWTVLIVLIWRTKQDAKYLKKIFITEFAKESFW